MEKLFALAGQQIVRDVAKIKNAVITCLLLSGVRFLQLFLQRLYSLLYSYVVHCQHVTDAWRF